MKKIFIGIALLLMISPAWSAIQWRGGTGELTIDGSSYANLIGYNSYNKIVQPLDNLLGTYCSEYLQYNSTTTITVKAGSCAVSNSQGTIRMFMLDTSDTNLTATNLDTGVAFATSTTYYVYATSPNATTQASTYYISTSNLAPSGQTYYKRLGSFSTDSSSNILQSSITSDNKVFTQASYDSGWFSASANGTYTKTHNLGTTKLLVKIYFSSDGGTTINSDCSHFSSDGPAYGYNLINVTTTALSVRAMANGVCGIYNGAGSVTDYASGYYRVIAIPLN